MRGVAVSLTLSLSKRERSIDTVIVVRHASPSDYDALTRRLTGHAS
jgi:hypothetical protein